MRNIFTILALVSSCHCISIESCKNANDDYREQRDNAKDCQEEKENGDKAVYSVEYRECRDAALHVFKG